jgi:hypothetical protein
VSIEYLDNDIDADRQESKDRFFELVSSLERELSLAEECGKKGEIEMLQIVRDIDDSEEMIEKSAHESGEIPPMRDYKAEADKITRKYLPTIIRNESIKIKDSIDNLGCMNKSCKKMIDDLTATVNYYEELYPELNLEEYVVELETVCRNFPYKRNLLERLLGK